MIRLSSFPFSSYNYISRLTTRSLSSFSSFSHGSRGGGGGGDDDTEAKDDDEFIFPVQYVSQSTVQFRWSGAEISRDFDLSSSAFEGKKEIIYNKRNVKMIRTYHQTEGAILFSLLKDQHNTWKICNIFKFGKEIQQEYPLVPTRGILDGFLKELCHKENFFPLEYPFQFVSSPHALKIGESISNLLVLPTPESYYEYYIHSSAPQRIITRSADQVLLETHLLLKDKDGSNITLVDLLLLVIDAETPTERIACVIVGGENNRFKSP